MRPQHLQGQIRPKISTMPRQKTEAAAYLEIYKLVNERTRLQKELGSLGERRDRIEKRLEVLNSEVAKLEVSAHELRNVTPLETAIAQPKAVKVEDFNTFLFEY
jgi:predicted  nucleic acid-binding Zn-ribbon protein